MKCTYLLTAGIFMSVAMPTYSSYSCNENYPANGTSLQFTDPNPRNLVVEEVHKYVSLVCCAANYDRITWYYKDQPYGNWWDKSFDNYIWLAQGDQELIIEEARYAMDGVYKCVISRDEDEEFLEFTQELWIKPMQAGSIFPNKESDQKSAVIGENVTFSCTFYVGDSEICSIIAWQRNDTGPDPYLFGFDHVFGPLYNYTQVEVEVDACTFGDKQTQATSLHIYNVTDDAYGMYYLTFLRERVITIPFNLSKIYAPDTPEPVILVEREYKFLAIVLAITVMLLCIIIVVYKLFKLDIQLIYHRCKDPEINDQRKYDIFISYSNSDEDREFVIYSLRKFLGNLSYNVCIGDINFLPGEAHATESVNAVNSSRCCILVLSPDYLNYQYCTLEFNKALEKLKKNIIPIMFREINQESLTRQEALHHLIKAGEVLKWKSNSNNKMFWKKLEVRMPRPRPRPSSSIEPSRYYIDRSTSTNSQTYLCPLRSVSNDSAISQSYSEENIWPTEKLYPVVVEGV